jgi:hypothetical protein
MAAGAPPSSRRYGQRQSGSTRGDVTLTVRGRVEWGRTFMCLVSCVCVVLLGLLGMRSHQSMYSSARKERRWACAEPQYPITEPRETDSSVHTALLRYAARRAARART